MRRAPPIQVLASLLLIAAGVVQPAVAAAPGLLRVTITPDRPQPGDVVLFRVAGAPLDLAGEWAGHSLQFFGVRDGVAALVGIDLDTPPGPIPWRLTRPAGRPVGHILRTGVVTVRVKSFATQHLTLPPGQVDLDAETLARVQSERTELEAVLASGVGERLWRGAFRVPVEGGRPTGGFGLRRVINGQPRSPHAGYDWAAPTGTPVAAANAGRVVLVAEHFFSGRNVVLDHGLRLFTLYFHLDETRVSVGERVAAGQLIGTVGATGRVTGPHLHLAVSLDGARVDPEALLMLAPPPDARDP